jgi:hypothetical protein
MRKFVALIEITVTVYVAFTGVNSISKMSNWPEQSTMRAENAIPVDISAIMATLLMRDNTKED